MVQLNQNALRQGARDPMVSALRPTIYRPSRPSPRVTAPDPRDGDSARRPATPERGKGVIRPS